MSQLGKFRDRAINTITGVGLRDSILGIQNQLDAISRELGDRSDIASGLEQQLFQIQQELVQLKRQSEARIETIRIQQDDTPERITDLERIRSSKNYEDFFTQKEPLISVRIATHQQREDLIDVAISSVLQQTYENFEIVVVSDGENEWVASQLKKLANPKIRFFQNIPKGKYPEDRYLRWMVAGAPVADRGAKEARGSWIAPLDDDDKFLPNHLEILLKLAQEERAELAYSAVLQKQLTWKTESVIFSNPPALNGFSFLGSLYLKSLDCFKYNSQSWMLDEPADWNLIRRMSQSGVRMASTPEVTAVMFSVSASDKPE